MAGHKNFFFNQYGSSQEQNLLEDLIIEAIGISGEDVLYIPRKINNFDTLYTADDQSSYEDVYSVVMYIESYDSFGGSGSFMSQVGLEIRDQVVFTIAQKVFYEEVGVNTAQIRPNEGDLIYFPLNNKVFQIKYVDKFQMFYQLGKLYTWKMTCELFEYSDEKFSTGYSFIDSIQTDNSTNELDNVFLDENGNRFVNESNFYLTNDNFSSEQEVPNSVNEYVNEESDKFVNFSTTNPFGDEH